MDEPQTTNWKSPLRENLESLIFPLILVLITRTFIFQAFKIPSESMRDTLLVGDHILVNKSLYFDPIPKLNISLFPTRDPGREDILVFKFPRDPGKDYIKRLIGLGGETITVDCPNVMVDGRLQDDSAYAIWRPQPYMRTRANSAEPFCPDTRPRVQPTVPKDQYFMMGDNRNNSEDSRFWGPLQRDLIKGKAFIIYFSWDTTEFDRISDGLSWKTPWHFLKTIRWRRTFQRLR